MKKILKVSGKVQYDVKSDKKESEKHHVGKFTDAWTLMRVLLKAIRTKPWRIIIFLDKDIIKK